MKKTTTGIEVSKIEVIKIINCEIAFIRDKNNKLNILYPDNLISNKRVIIRSNNHILYNYD